MKNLVSDIWHDLREKRLWPIAAVLLLGLVAVPVVLSKSGAEPVPAPPEATSAADPTAKDDQRLAQIATVQLDDSASNSGSSLDTFDPSDPFRPPAKVVRRGEDSQDAGAGPGDVEVELEQGATVSEEEGGGGSASPAPAPDGRDAPDGDRGGTETVTTQYRYVIDATFTANGKKRRVKGMERLDMLPSQASPLLLFLGTEASGANAVFLVDSTLQAAGEGTCKPSAKECGFLHIGAGSEHEFTNEQGDSYTLRIDEIRKVKVKADAKPAKRGGRPRAGAAVGASRRFVPIMISDLVSVSSTEAANSEPGPEGR